MTPATPTPAGTALTEAGAATVTPLVVDKPWGRERIWAHVPGQYVGKFLDVKAGQQLSLQYHHHKHETMTLISGSATLMWGRNLAYLVGIPMVIGQSTDIPPGVVHRLIADTDCTVVEVSTDHMDDVVRLVDGYGRADVEPC